MGAPKPPPPPAGWATPPLVVIPPTPQYLGVPMPPAPPNGIPAPQTPQSPSVVPRPWASTVAHAPIIPDDPQEGMRSKPGIYKDQYYCSRGEIRWALIMDHLSLPWQYEAEEYILHSKPNGYNPDFRLLSEDYYIEYKGGYEEDYLIVCQQLADHLKEAVVLTWGFVGWWLHIGKRTESKYHGGAAVALPGQDPGFDRVPCICPRCGSLEWPHINDANPGCWYEKGRYGISAREAMRTPSLMNAVEYQSRYNFMPERFYLLDKERFEDLQEREVKLYQREAEARDLHEKGALALRTSKSWAAQCEKDAEEKKAQVLEKVKLIEQAALTRLDTVEACAQYLPELVRPRAAPQQRPKFHRTRREFLRHRRHISYSGGPG
jgi:hypothetical protein